ncbi:hypothetical protein [Bartonella sp. B30(2025)]
MLKKNVFLCVFTVAVCFFSQIMSASARFYGHKSHEAISMSEIVQKNNKLTNLVVMGALDRSTRNEKEDTIGKLGKVSPVALATATTGLFSAISQGVIVSLISTFVLQIVQYLSKLFKIA